nr:PEP-CTERM sorting domain-containing protein [uncultured Roseateles sp.]
MLMTTWFQESRHIGTRLWAKGALRAAAATVAGLLGLLGLLGLCAAPAAAAPITLTPTQTSVVLDAGDSIVITGQITNVSGGPLLTTDFFLSLSGYPFPFVDVTPLLGDPEVVIPDRTISPVLDLLMIATLPDLLADLNFNLAILLSDINGNFADEVSVAVTVRAAAASEVPEPGTLALALIALVPLVAGRAGRRPGSSGPSATLLSAPRVGT